MGCRQKFAAPSITDGPDRTEIRWKCLAEGHETVGSLMNCANAGQSRRAAPGAYVMTFV